MFTKRIQKLLKDHRVYIVPSKNGLIYLFTSIMVLLLGVIYSNNTALLISFLLISLFLLHMFFTNFNLAGLRIRNLSIKDSYLGETFNLNMQIENSTRSEFHSLHLDLHFTDKESLTVKIPTISAQEHSRIEVPFRLDKRGVFSLSKVTLWTRFPMGLFYAWSPVSFQVEFCAYPKALGVSLHDQLIVKTFDEESLEVQKQDIGDFHEHSKYVSGSPLKNIDWKVFAKTEKLYLKNYSQGDIKYYRFQLNPAKNIEQELSQLSLWIRDISKTHNMWSLQIENTEIGPGNGDHFFKLTMKELAAYES